MISFPLHRIIMEFPFYVCMHACMQTGRKGCVCEYMYVCTYGWMDGGRHACMNIYVDVDFSFCLYPIVRRINSFKVLNKELESALEKYSVIQNLGGVYSPYNKYVAMCNNIAIMRMPARSKIRN